MSAKRSAEKLTKGLGGTPAQPTPEQLFRELVRFDDAAGRNLLRSREGPRLEYKQAFHWNDRDEYARTLAGMANNRGGLIIFGVKDRPRQLVGLTNEHFDRIDPAKVAGYLNSLLAPEIDWSIDSLQVRGVRIGLLAVGEARVKPVICIKNDGRMTEGEVHFRQSGHTERIKHTQLEQIIQKRLEAERATWRRLLQQISHIGAADAAVVDLGKGVVGGPSGNVILTPDQLKAVRIIQEGRFTQRNEPGVPTLRLVGDARVAEPIAVDRVVVKELPVVLTDKRHVLSMLKNEVVPAPEEYVRYACSGSSVYMPIYFFAMQAGMSAQDLADVIAGSARPHLRSRLVSRILGESLPPIGVIDGAGLSDERRQAVEALVEGSADRLTELDLRRVLEAITHLTEVSVPTLALLAPLVEMRFETVDSATKTLMRKAIASLDERLYRSSLSMVEKPSPEAIRE